MQIGRNGVRYDVTLPRTINSDIDTRNVFMASFDVASLFTNIPVNETIGIISNALFSDHQFFHGLDRSEFEKLLSLSVKKTVTSFLMATYTNRLTVWQ